MTTEIPDGRPRLESRTFASKLLENRLAEIKQLIRDKSTRQIFTNCWPNTLDTTIFSHHGDLSNHDHRTARPETWVITGDIPAMWLRDSANQISAYLHLLKGLPSESWTALYRLVLGVVYTQAACILHYPFANAFLPPTSPVEAENTDHVLPRIPPSIRDKKGTRCGIGVWEAKFELDSLASFIDLSAKVLAIRSDLLYNPAWIDAVELVLEVCQAQQRGTDEEAAILHKQAYQQDHDTPTHSDHGRKGASSIYRFNRETRTASETRSLSGLGEPARRCRLIKSAFRPSDDATVLPFLIPSNAFFSTACQTLSHLVKQFLAACDTEPVDRPAKPQRHRLERVSLELEKIHKQVEDAIWLHAIVKGPTGQRMFAYEVDGYGSYLLADDANLPSLLSLPFLGFIDQDHEVYRATRDFVLSRSNKWYFCGVEAAGIGGMHIGMDYVWPMSIITRALTSDDDEEVLDCLHLLNTTTAGTGFMHESFHVDDSSRFTRSWFAWVNGLYGQLILQILEDRAYLLN